MEGGENDSFKQDFLRIQRFRMDGLVATSLLTTDNEQPNANYHNNSGSFHISHQVSQNLEIDLLGLGNKSDINYPGNIKSAAYPILDQYQNIEEILISLRVKIPNGRLEFERFIYLF